MYLSFLPKTYKMTAALERKKSFTFWITFIILLSGGLSTLYYLHSNSQLNILPLLIETKDHPAPLRTPSTFVEDFSDKASIAKLSFEDNTSFSFKYQKSIQKENAFAGVWFPTENIAIDFSKYDFIEIEIDPTNARLIPFNLSVQNKKETHQYVRSYIEVVDDVYNYSLPLEDFITPISWYKRNGISQVEIPKPDLSKIEAISFESCQLLPKDVIGKYTITKLVLKKDLLWIYITIIALIILFIPLLRGLIFGLMDDDTQSKQE